MNAAEDRTRRRGGSGWAGGKRLASMRWSSSLWVLSVLVSVMAMCWVGSSANGAAVASAANSRSQPARSRLGLDARSDSSPDSASETDASDASSSQEGASSSESSGDDGPGNTQRQAVAVPAAVVTARPNPRPSTQIVGPVPDIFANRNWMGGVGDIPEIGDAPPGHFAAAQQHRQMAPPAQSHRSPSFPLPGAGEGCLTPPECTDARLMRDDVSFAYESLFNVLAEISQASVRAFLADIRTHPRSDCADIVSRNVSHIGLRIKHGRRDASMQIEVASGSVHGGVVRPKSATYTTGFFSGLGQFRNHIVYNDGGEAVIGTFFVKFPQANRFVSFPIIIETCRKCGQLMAPVYPIHLHLIPASKVPDEHHRNEAVKALIQYTCI